MKNFRRRRHWTHQDTWKNQYRKKETPWPKIIGIITVICMVLFLNGFAVNLTLRTDSAYQYTLQSSQLLTSGRLNVDEEELIGKLSRYMQHRTNDFSLMSSNEYDPEDIFKKEDRKFLANIRKGADIALVVGVLAFFGLVVCYYLFWRWHKKKEHIHYYKCGMAATLAVMAVMTLSKGVPKLVDLTWAHLMPKKITDDHILTWILNKTFLWQDAIFEAIIVAIALAILGYITWEMSGKKRVFRGIE